MSQAQKYLALYSGALTVMVTGGLLMGLAPAKPRAFDEINVQRINIVEPDGNAAHGDF